MTLTRPGVQDSHPLRLCPALTCVFALALQEGSGAPAWDKGALVLGNTWEVLGALRSIQLGIGRGVMGKLEELWKAECPDTQKLFAYYDFFFSLCQVLMR